MKNKLKLVLALSLMLFPAFAFADGSDCKDEGSNEKNRGRSKDYCEVRDYPFNDAPYRSYNSYNVYGRVYSEPSRYNTSQGWSRGSSYWGSHRSNLPTTGYTSPPRR